MTRIISIFNHEPIGIVFAAGLPPDPMSRTTVTIGAILAHGYCAINLDLLVEVEIGHLGAVALLDELMAIAEYAQFSAAITVFSDEFMTGIVPINPARLGLLRAVYTA